MVEALLIHVSDLHFGHQYFTQPPPTGGGGGLHGHEAAALESLEVAVRDLKDKLQPAWSGLVVSGDVTVRGEPSEFALALTFLQHRFRTEWNNTVGLGDLLEEAMTVPGNHDHLAGLGVLRGVMRWNPAADPRDKYFGQSTGTVWWRHSLHRFPTFDIQFCGIDTCGANTLQLGARGSIDGQALLELGTAIKATASIASAARPMLRLAVMHHSPSMNGALHCLDLKSHQTYEKFCKDNGIHFTLTGHAHRPYIAVLPSGVVELRCGTTSQHGAASGKHGNTFMAHVVEATAGGHQWTTRLFQRKIAAGPFVEATSLRQSWSF